MMTKVFPLDVGRHSGLARTKGCLTLLTAMLLLTMPSAHAAAAPADQRPNVLLIMADDLGYSDIGSFGGEIETPHLDRLAAEGLRFTQFYNATRCSPSRASLLTGLYPHQTGVAETPDFIPRPPKYLPHLSPNSVTLAQVLRAAGYRTMLSGKWHLGMERPHWPTDHGFENFFGMIDYGGSHFGNDHVHQTPGKTDKFFRSLWAKDGEPFTPPDTGFFSTDAFGENAVQFLDRVGGDRVGGGKAPFFLYLAFMAPHWPLHALPEDIAKYRGRFMEGWDVLRLRRWERMRKLGVLPPHLELAPRGTGIPAWKDLSEPEKIKWDHLMAVYAAMIDGMDRQIGRVLAKLAELDEADNTLVLFLSDNGGSPEQINRGRAGALPGTPESFFGYGMPWANLSNTPFRLFKAETHEGGIATPLIVRWPRGVKSPGRIVAGAGHLIDIMPTILEVTRARYPVRFAGSKILPVEGRSLVPAFSGRPVPGRRQFFWEHWGHRAVRDGRWKLVSSKAGPWELYDMEQDRTELRDLAAQQPERVREISAAYDRWAARAGAVPYPFPIKHDQVTSPPF
jgi:arylsulfatase